jgi:hypothetical protein
MNRSSFFRDQNRKLYRNALSKYPHDRRRQVLTSLLRLMDQEQEAIIACSNFEDDALFGPESIPPIQAPAVT